ncbi:hypothetical protein [Siminovitchia acidinfaciens]|nr:hypothetical protein [Siminovitchia acidinfaciens]
MGVVFVYLLPVVMFNAIWDKNIGRHKENYLSFWRLIFDEKILL